MLKEFKKFALRGNVIDLAVGFIIGAAFAGIINSLVKDIVMPVISLLIPGEQGYKNWQITIGEKAIPYGLFIGEVVNFLIVAFALYIFLVKFIGWLTKLRKEEAAAAAAPAAPPPPSREEALLAEIRDILAAKQKSV
jgi:large conductance mechanosensitive channel